MRRETRIIAAAFALAACGAQPGADANAQKMPERTEIGELAKPPEGLETDEAGPPASEVASLTVVPVTFQGRWAATPADCAPAGETGLTIARDRLRFHERAGDVIAVTIVSAREIEVLGRYEGDGVNRDERHRLTLAEDGATLTVASRGASLPRARCG